MDGGYKHAPDFACIVWIRTQVRTTRHFYISENTDLFLRFPGVHGPWLNWLSDLKALCLVLLCSVYFSHSED